MRLVASVCPSGLVGPTLCTCAMVQCAPPSCIIHHYTFAITSPGSCLVSVISCCFNRLHVGGESFYVDLSCIIIFLRIKFHTIIALCLWFPDKQRNEKTHLQKDSVRYKAILFKTLVNQKWQISGGIS